MTKDQLLQLVSEAYDDGARVKISIYKDTKQEADEVADQYADHFNTPVYTGGEKVGAYWHEYEDGRVEFVAYSMDKEETA